MRNAKKIFILLLSLALLCGIFAVAALAEDGTEPAAGVTVAYPDGATDFFAVGEAIVPREIVTKGSMKLYFGEGNTLFVVADGWSFKLGDETLSDMTVTDAMAGETLTVEGGVKVYAALWNADLSEIVETVTASETYSSDIRAYFSATDKWTGGQTLKLYEYVMIPHDDQQTVFKTAAPEDTAYLDLNGHHFRFEHTKNNATILVTTGSLYVYSSVPGGKISAANAKALIKTSYAGELAQGLIGHAYFGERDITKTEYGKNLTVECRTFNDTLQDPATLGIYGGTYVQATSATVNYFLMVSRLVCDRNDQMFTKISNATFILNRANTFALHWMGAKDVNVTNCTFISNAEGAKAAANAATSTAAAIVSPYSAPKFANCDFVNVLPTVLIENPITHENQFTITYENCRFSLKGAVDGSIAYTGVKPDGSTEEQYLARCAQADKITVDGVEYFFNYTLASSFLTVEWADGDKTHPYWALGSSPCSDTVLPNSVEKQADGTYLATINRFVAPVGITVVEAAHLGTTATELESRESTIITAFSYQDDEGNTQFMPLGATPAENGAQLVEILEALTGGKVVMYSDVALASGVLFGTFAQDVTLDLNGFTLEISAGLAAGADLSGFEAVLGLKNSGAKSFTLTSSLAGAKILNPTDCALIGVGAQNSVKVLIDGANLTYVGNAALAHAIETGANANVSLTVNGGTYIFEGNTPAFSFLNSAAIKEATVVLLGDAPISVLAAHNLDCDASFSLENVSIYSKNETDLFSFVNADMTVASDPNTDSCNYALDLNGCSFAGVALAAEISDVDSLTFKGATKADTAERLLLVYGAQPASTVLAKYNVAVAYGDEQITIKYLCYADAANVTTIVYGEGFENALYCVGSHLDLLPAENFDESYLDVEKGVYVQLAGYMGYLASEVVTEEMAGKTLNVYDYTKYEEKVLAFVVTEGGAVTDFAIAESASAIDEFKAAVAAASENAVITLYSDITVSGAIASNAAVVLDLAGYKLAVDTAFAPAALLTVKNGTVLLVADAAVLFDGAVAIENAEIYNLAAEAALTSAAATVKDAKVYNLVLGSSATLSGTVFHTDTTASALGAGVENVLYNNNSLLLNYLDEEYEIVFTFVATDDAEKICAVSFVYKEIERAAKKYFVGSIPVARVLAIEGYYYDFVGTEPLAADAVIEGTFFIAEDRVIAQLAITDALNFVYYLQKQDGIADVVFSGVAQDLAAAEIVLRGGVEYYAFTVVFEDISDALDIVTLSYNVTNGSETGSVYAEIDLLSYAEEIFAGEEQEDKALVYALLAYVESVMNYFDKDVTEIKAFNKLYAEYATEFVAPEAKEIASNCLRGVLYIVDEKVSMALRIDPDFKGEILISTAENPEVAHFIYKDIVEVDGNTYFILPDLAFSELTEEYSVEIKMYGEVVETFTYTLADYTGAMAVQNMGYTPLYARALYTFATLAAAYVA